jgi:hypothetical protein
MPTYQLTAELSPDGTIRVPPDVPLQPGPVSVTLEARPSEPPVAKPENIGRRLARAARDLGITDLPSDLAENHDYYAHGAPKGVDRQ